MNSFASNRSRKDRSQHAINITLGTIRSAILRNKSLCLQTTNNVDYWYEIIRKEFPDVNLRKAEAAIFINEKQ